MTVKKVWNVCPRCSNGRPVCSDPLPGAPPRPELYEPGWPESLTRERYDHETTCATYEWADDVCEPCQRQMDEEYG